MSVRQEAKWKKKKQNKNKNIKQKQKQKTKRRNILNEGEKIWILCPTTCHSFAGRTRTEQTFNVI